MKTKDIIGAFSSGFSKALSSNYFKDEHVKKFYIEAFKKYSPVTTLSKESVSILLNKIGFSSSFFDNLTTFGTSFGIDFLSSLVANENNNGAIQKQLIDLFNYMKEWTSTPNVYEQTGVMLDKTIKFFSFLERYADEIIKDGNSRHDLFVLWYKYDVYSKDSLGYILTAKIRLFIDMKDCDMIFCSISF